MVNIFRIKMNYLNLSHKIFTVSEVAKKQGFDYVFDRSGDIYLVYARSEWNLNDAI